MKKYGLIWLGLLLAFLAGVLIHVALAQEKRVTGTAWAESGAVIVGQRVVDNTWFEVKWKMKCNVCGAVKNVTQTKLVSAGVFQIKSYYTCFKCNETSAVRIGIEVHKN